MSDDECAFRQYLRDDNQRTSLLDLVSSSFRRCQSLCDAIHRVLQEVSVALSARAALLTGWDRPTGSLMPFCSYCPTPRQAAPVPLRGGALSRMGTEGSALRPTALFGANALASEFEDAALTSAVSAPILVRDALQGVLSVLDIGGLLQEDDLLNGLVQEIANLLGQEIDRSLGPALAQQRIASGEYCLAHLFHQGSKWVAVMFADLRGFTSATELLAVRRGHLVDSGGMPVDLPDPAGLVSQFCGRMVEEVCVFGRVDKLIGDAVMAVVGDLLPAVDEERTVLQAVCTSTRMCDVFQDLVDEWQDPGGGWLPQFRRHFNEDVNLRLGIGINFGPAVFGFYGSEDHKEYTAIGDVVNTAQRLEDQASREDDRGVDREPILISQTVYVRAAPYLTGIVPHRLSVPGKARPITGYGVTGFDRERCRAAHGGACDQCPGGQWRWEAREAAGAPSP